MSREAAGRGECVRLLFGLDLHDQPGPCGRLKRDPYPSEYLYTGTEPLVTEAHMSGEVITRLLNEDVLVPVLIAGSIILIVGMKALAGVFKTFARERTRREIAAFIAEGSMSPEQGERLMKAGTKDC